MSKELEKYEDVVLSSRVRLARNLSGALFPNKMDNNMAEEVKNKVFGSFYQDRDKISVADLTAVNRQAFVEKHLSSPLLMKNEHSGLVLSKDEKIAIMINEEDHLRIQCILQGLDLHTALSIAMQEDETIHKEIAYAEDPLWGFLTACPTNVGTGLRASTMMHLPALSLQGSMQGIQQMLDENGLQLRGMYGEGSEALGHIYQVSNRSSIARSEEAIVQYVTDATLAIVERERKAREAIIHAPSITLCDRISRALGTLRYAQLLSLEEFMRLWSDVGLGIACNLLDADRKKINTLLIEAQPAQLLMAAKSQNLQEAAKLRADLCRKVLKEENENLSGTNKE